MFLDTTSKSVRVLLSGAVTTNQAVVNSDWGDNTTTSYTAGSADFLTNGATPVTIVAAPAAATQRIVQRINVYNADTAPITVTIQTVNGANNRTEVTVTLQVAERLEFVKEQGWSTYNAQGSKKVVAVTSTVEPGYIDGMRMTWNSGTSVTISSGSVYIPSVGFNVNFNSALTKAGLALSANTFYHVYAFLNAGVPDVEIVTTAPSAPYNGVARTKSGDTTRRYIGSLRTDAGSAVYNFLHTDSDILYQSSILPAPFLILTGGVATVATTVALASLIPPTARAAIIVASNSDTGQRADLGNNGGTIGMAFANPNTLNYLRLPMNATQDIQYAYFAAPAVGSLSIRVQGYQFER